MSPLEIAREVAAMQQMPERDRGFLEGALVQLSDEVIRMSEPTPADLAALVLDRPDRFELYVAIRDTLAEVMCLRCGAPDPRCTCAP